MNEDYTKIGFFVLLGALLAYLMRDISQEKDSVDVDTEEKEKEKKPAIKNKTKNNVDIEKEAVKV